MKNKLIQVISPYGKWSHSKGLQIVDKNSALKMAKNFPSELWQKLFKKIPIYLGHPDEYNKKSALKKQIIGYVEKIIALDDCIAGVCTYNNEVYKKILEKELRSMSPRWKTLDLEDGTFMPIELISVGLTNEPNIANAGEILSASTLLNQRETLSKKALKEKSIYESLSQSILNSKKCIQRLKELKNIQEDLTQSVSKKLLTSALNSGAISANECASWANEFKDKFSETRQRLIKTSTQKKEHNLKELISITKQRMTDKNISWKEAYTEIKRENFS
ncbi:MAG: phage protease [Opitutales bacterium]